MQDILDKIEKNARLTESEPRATQLWLGVKKVLDRILPNYEERLGIPQADILAAIDERRDYWAVNYYQDSKWPDIDGDVMLFENLAELKAKFPSMKFRCPMCKGVTTHPYTCNSGQDMEPGKKCDWKTYGLFRTLGEGLRFTIKDGFLKNPIIDEIFKPLELEQ